MISSIYKIKNKRIIYLLSIVFLLVFCLVLNITFSIFIHSANLNGANITVNDLDYKMVINEVNLDSSVGIKDNTTSIVGDRIIKIRAGAIEEFNIALTSLNNISTKYEIIYNFCLDSICSSYIESDSDVNIYYANDSSEINGIILSNGVKEIGIITDNKTEKDYFVQISLNVGYAHNDLELVNQINTSFDGGTMEGNLRILAYVNGEEVETFPTEPNYETSVVCNYANGELASARGVFVFGVNGWELNVYGINNNLTTCRVDFTEVLQITYSILSERLKCANFNNTLNEDDMIINYSGNCSLIDDSSITGDGNWRIKLTSNGTLNLSGFLYVDLFLVGGGMGSGGYGGYSKTYNRVAIDNQKGYEVIIGGEGQATTFDSIYKADGGTASAGGAIGGTCEYESLTIDNNCTYTTKYGLKNASNAYTKQCSTWVNCGNPDGCIVTCCAAAGGSGAANTGNNGGKGNSYCSAGKGGTGIVILRNAI